MRWTWREKMSPCHILVVEDERGTRETWKYSLEKEGFRVEEAENGKEALGIGKNQIFDLALVDLKMPVMGGTELIARLKKEHPLLQIIIISGKGEKKDLIEAVNHHVFAYLEKPADFDLLLQKIQEAMEKRDPALLALEKLAERNPDDTILLAGEESFTASQLYNEVRQGTKFGREYAHEFQESLRELPESTPSADDLLGIKGIME